VIDTGLTERRREHPRRPASRARTSTCS
jgi:hypothetical protein